MNMQAPIIGLIVNPIAGMGGSVGLKGTDGVDVLEEALKRGAKPVALGRCIRALLSLKDSLLSVTVVTCRGMMGENEAATVQIPYELLLIPVEERTSAVETKLAAKQLEEKGVRLLLFAGGDGTARDISEAINSRVAVLGIPSGVKNYSAVFASSPETAGEVSASYLKNEISTIDSEVLDFDEKLMREGTIATKISGVLRVPSSRRFMQNAKDAFHTAEEESEQQAIAKFIVEEMDPEFQYVLGPGSTTSRLAQHLGLDKTLLGVDVVFEGRLLAKDVTGRELEELVQQRPTKLILSPVGGQGFILGQGNQQLTPLVIRTIGKENIMVICTATKLANLVDRRFRIDTGDRALDAQLLGYWRLVVGYREFAVVAVDQ